MRHHAKAVREKGDGHRRVVGVFNAKCTNDEGQGAAKDPQTRERDVLLERHRFETSRPLNCRYHIEEYINEASDDKETSFEEALELHFLVVSPRRVCEEEERYRCEGMANKLVAGNWSHFEDTPQSAHACPSCHYAKAHDNAAPHAVKRAHKVDGVEE